MIDTHCHLTFDDYKGREEDVLADAAEAGVTGAVTVSTTTADCGGALALAQRFDRVWCTAGVHPLYSDKGPHDWDRLAEVAAAPECVAWGELGLDNHYDKPPGDVQRGALAEQLALIERQRSDPDAPIDKPIVLHCREAYSELIGELRKTSLDPSRFVFHCFTGGPDEAREVLDFGAWISFTGVVTFKNAPQVREAAKLVPNDRIMAETDAPFLTPAPHRKVKPNEPRFAIVVAKALAEIRGEAWDDFHARINRNTERFFGISNVE